jgi:hypothetical protein
MGLEKISGGNDDPPFTIIDEEGNEVQAESLEFYI